MTSHIRIFPTGDEMGVSASNIFYESAQRAIDARGVFHVALSGGSTPVHMYKKIRVDERIAQIDWGHVHVFWGDERCVPPTHPDSNYRLANDELLRFLPVPIENIHRMKGEINPQEAADEYQSMLRNTMGATPAFDLIYLGLGDDGHTASIFPGEEYSTEDHVWVESVFVEKLHTYRLTLTYQVINKARQVVFLVMGEKKSEVVSKILDDQITDRRYPAELISPERGELIWLLDQNAARLIDG